MFMFKAKTVLQECKFYMPEMIKNVELAYKNRTDDNDFCRPDLEAFEGFTTIIFIDGLDSL